MSNKTKKILKAVFADPVSGTLKWQDIESLFISKGCKVIEKSGSSVHFVKSGIVGSFHRPHPAKEAKRYQVKDARRFLVEIGEKP